MNTIGLTASEQHDIFRMLAVVLWLGNVQYTEMDDGNSQVGDTGVTDFIGYLMEVDSALVEKVMTQRTIEIAGSPIDVPLNPAQATSGRDALAKAIYNNLFEWIVQRINLSMKARGAVSQIIGILVSVKFASGATLTCGVQDIFGFEIFEVRPFCCSNAVKLML
jgi:myosin-1